MRVGPHTILVQDHASGPESGVTALCTRVSPADQKADLDRQLGRLVAYAAGAGLEVGRAVIEVGSGLNGERSRLQHLLADRTVTTTVVEHRERLARFGVEYPESALAVQGRRIVVVDPAELEDDLVRDVEAYSSGITALADALDNFSSSKKGTRRGCRVGFPRTKKRSARRSFTVTTGGFGIVDGRHVRLPVVGVIRTKERTATLLARLDAGLARSLSVTVSETAGRWFVSFRCVVKADPRIVPVKPDAVTDVDLGVHRDRDRKMLATVAALVL